MSLKLVSLLFVLATSTTTAAAAALPSLAEQNQPQQQQILLAPSHATHTAASYSIPSPPSKIALESDPQITTTPQAASLINGSRCPGPVIQSDSVFPEPYCCVGGIFEEADFALTKWFYDHTGTDLPSTTFTPTTCVMPVMMTAAEFEMEVSAALITGLPSLAEA